MTTKTTKEETMSASSTLKSTPQLRRVIELMIRNGFDPADEEFFPNSRSRMKARLAYSNGTYRFHVDFDKDSRVTGWGYSLEGPGYDNGYAEVHREGRHLGVWRPSFTSTQAINLLAETVREKAAAS